MVYIFCRYISDPPQPLKWCVTHSSDSHTVAVYFTLSLVVTMWVMVYIFHRYISDPPQPLKWCVTHSSDSHMVVVYFTLSLVVTMWVMVYIFCRCISDPPQPLKWCVTHSSDSHMVVVYFTLSLVVTMWVMVYIFCRYISDPPQPLQFMCDTQQWQSHGGCLLHFVLSCYYVGHSWSPIYHSCQLMPDFRDCRLVIPSWTVWTLTVSRAVCPQIDLCPISVAVSSSGAWISAGMKQRSWAFCLMPLSALCCVEHHPGDLAARSCTEFAAKTSLFTQTIFSLLGRRDIGGEVQNESLGANFLLTWATFPPHMLKLKKEAFMD